MKKLALIIAALPVLTFAQATDEDAFVFAVVPRVETVTKEVRECKEVSALAAAQAAVPAGKEDTVRDGRSARPHDAALTPQWLVAANGTGKLIAPEENAGAAMTKAGESCRVTERTEQVQDGWQVFMRYQGRNHNAKVASNPPQVGEYVKVTYNSRGEVVIAGKPAKK
ncbi:hypothetical protein [Ramlibacter alkalitolerans]|uniref:Uncharacterized protein n=1 Tax=Ramlibacter alkalitolerans TaxID=2039631 RepID=A0ABS1JU91_9BURK|nr:hypothetical protein [Ramlibacter alkalitolerans]MBL0427792.1 hypothetical protein [Ramlibacter alkalitolerans]